MKRFVARNAQGKIVGSFAAPQPGSAEEELPDDTPELRAFETPPPETDRDRVTVEAARSPMTRGLIKFLAKKFNTTPAAVIASIKAGLD